MQKPNDGPQRTCAGCMRRDSKRRMLRIVKRENSLTVDEDGRMPGRGAYLHYKNRCITDFAHNRARELRSLRRTVSFDERRKLAELIHARLDSSGALE
jgi:predicted RNA-binding protein YlxR (DUF448 family)